MASVSINVNRQQYLELQNLALGAFDPLSGFMKEDELAAVVESSRLPGGQVFPLPVVLDLTDEQARAVQGADILRLSCDGIEVGEVDLEELYTCDKTKVASRIFGTIDSAHPGVAHFFAMGDWFVGGGVRLAQRLPSEYSDWDLTPQETRAHFAERGWATVVGFQTRNVPHRAHESLLRLALELCDGLFIQPLVGRKKIGDYDPLAILTGYQTLIDDFLPRERVLLGVLTTSMRYAGPREAVFHALVRRNYGCSHFIVGRDHAGVGNYYATYEAQEFTRHFDGDLGIQILRFRGPFYCSICDGMVTDRTCPHLQSAPHATRQISGTDLRSILVNDHQCPRELMRPEVLDKIRHLSLFITEEAE